MPADNRPDLGREALVVPMLRVIAVLEVRAIKKRAVIGMRDSEQRAQLESVNFPTEMIVATVERQI